MSETGTSHAHLALAVTRWQDDQLKSGGAIVPMHRWRAMLGAGPPIVEPLQQMAEDTYLETAVH